METVEVYDTVKMPEEVESCYNLMEVTSPKKRKNKAQEDVEKPKKPRWGPCCFHTQFSQNIMALCQAGHEPLWIKSSSFQTWNLSVFRSAYLLYYFDVHHIMQQEIPNLAQSEINKRISESWKRLSVAEKGYYLEKAKLEKEGVETVSYSLHIMPWYEQARACQAEVTCKSFPSILILILLHHLECSTWAC